MKRVYHIISHFDVGGAERVAMNISMSGNKDIEYHIVEVQRGHSSYTRDMICEMKNNGIKYHRSWSPLYFHFHYYVDRLISFLFPLRFIFLWLRYKPEVIHTHTEMPDMALWLTLKIFPFIHVKVVRTIHNTVLWSGMNYIGPRVERFMQSENANVAISKNVQLAYENAYGQRPRIIYNGISPVPQRRYDGIINGKINICFAGRFEEQKGIKTLCEIIRKLKDDDRYFFHVFGTGRLQSEVDELNSMPNVKVNAPVPNISSLLGSFDYLIMPSVHEGLSILALEASFNGLPLMINRCAGLVDTLPDDWPLSVDDNDIDQWMHLFNDVIPYVDRNNLMNKAKTYVQQHFSLKKMQDEYERLY